MMQQMNLASGKEDRREEKEAHLEAAEKAMLARQKAQDTAARDTMMPTEMEIKGMMPTEKEIKGMHKKEKKKQAVKDLEQPEWHEAARGAFIDSLADLMGGSDADDEKNLKKKAEKTVMAREEREAKKKADDLKKRKEEEKKKEEAIKEKKQQLQEEREAIKEWKEDEKHMRNVSLYCIALMMPFGYEPGLLYEQQKRGVGIYGCDESIVFSNQTKLMSGLPSPVPVTVMEGSLAVEYGGKWMTALNTGVFNRLWMEVIRVQRYRRYDWSVKADPDAVFFPDRLLMLLQ